MPRETSVKISAVFRFASLRSPLTAPVPSARKTDGSESVFGEVIFSYTRAQAIEGGVLIDVTPTALEAGFRFPVAATADLMGAIETIPRQYSHEDKEGRLRDVLWMASLAARRAKPGFSRIAFEVIQLP
jgi:hypothetical protein